MSVTGRLIAVVVAAAALGPGAAGVAHAQFAAGGPDRNQPAGDAFDELPETRARLQLSAFYYDETASGNSNTQPPGADQPTKHKLLYTDLRGKVEADRYSGTKWFLKGDFRLRLAGDTTTAGKTDNATDDGRSAAARGLFGGTEYQLKEAYGEYRGSSVRFAAGRIIVREVDATKIDGVAARYQLSTAWETGAFLGLYPFPFSRSLGDDYATVGVTGAPVAGGAYTGYRFLRAYGNLGAVAMVPRANPPGATESEPVRVSVTLDGYARATDDMNVFHYLVFDAAGGNGLTNAHVIAQYRTSPRLRLEGGATYMSTYALRLFVTDFLEVANAETNAPPINNLTLVRLGRYELRGGMNYDFLESRSAVFADVRYRRRAPLDKDELPGVLSGTTADTVLDVSLGARRKKWFAGTDVSGSVVVIRGERTASEFYQAAAEHGFFDDRADARLGLTVVRYADSCEPADPTLTCTGSARGQTFRLNLGAVWLKDEHWLFVGDYVFSRNSAKSGAAPGATTLVQEPTITGHSLYVQAQYRF